MAELATSFKPLPFLWWHSLARPLLLALLLVACGNSASPPEPPAAPDLAAAADMSAPPDLAKDPGIAPACRSCSQSDPGACGGVPSVCGCYPGPACCCR